MIISLRHKFVLLAMPKCASSALERAIGPKADMVFRDPPDIKHSNYHRYRRYLMPLCERFGGGPPETLCLFREPVDWLGSWWRYRQRPFLDGKPNSTRDVSFDAFIEMYLAGTGPTKGIGKQSSFVGFKGEPVAVDHVFRYEDLPQLTAWITRRTGWEVDLERINVSPMQEVVLSPAIRTRLQEALAADFEIYDQIGRG